MCLFWGNHAWLTTGVVLDAAQDWCCVYSILTPSQGVGQQWSHSVSFPLGHGSCRHSSGWDYKLKGSCLN